QLLPVTLHCAAKIPDLCIQVIEATLDQPAQFAVLGYEISECLVLIIESARQFDRLTGGKWWRATNAAHSIQEPFRRRTEKCAADNHKRAARVHLIAHVLRSLELIAATGRAFGWWITAAALPVVAGCAIGSGGIDRFLLVFVLLRFGIVWIFSAGTHGHYSNSNGKNSHSVCLTAGFWRSSLAICHDSLKESPRSSMICAARASSDRELS